MMEAASVVKIAVFDMKGEGNAGCAGVGLAGVGVYAALFMSK
jgi:hypothetical protein